MKRITADTWKCINCLEQKRKRRRVDVDGQESFPWKTSLRKYLFKIEKKSENVFLEKTSKGNGKYSRVNFVEIYGVPMQPQEDVLSAVKEIGKALGMDVVDSMFDAYHRMGDRAAHNSIYVNEDLTPTRRRLLGMGRQLKSNNDDRY
ncbi:hypothetical protein J6590_086326 [Homalodisca vitripennis]|nr:hypothetical protein J6590_086326 [Homalodisca vitripennis]